MPSRQRLPDPSPSARPLARRSRPISDLVQTIERDNPDLAAARGVSSAALRAGDMIRAMRKTAKLSQSALASALRVSQARVSELEAGTGPQGPTWDVMERVAEVCNARLGWVARHAAVEAPEIYQRLASRGLSTNAMKITEVGGQTYVELEDGEDGVNVIIQPLAVMGGG